ncbi:MAG: hypothetical protein LBR89_04405 [Holosporales bacterium]|jgi:hypothetical protein|nr:hypothetical protein [Holosporales bacterium]
MFLSYYSNIHLLSILIFSPLMGALFLTYAKNHRNIQNCALWINVFTVTVALLVALIVDNARDGFHLVEQISWIEYCNIHYHIGVDSLSVVMILIITSIFPVLTVISFGASPYNYRMRMIILTLLETSLLLMVCAVDVILLFMAFISVFVCLSLLLNQSVNKPVNMRLFALQFTLGGVLLFIVLLTVSYAATSFSYEIIRHELKNAPFSSSLSNNFVRAFLMCSLLILGWPLVHRPVREAPHNRTENEQYDVMCQLACVAFRLIICTFFVYRFFPLTVQRHTRVYILWGLMAALCASLAKFCVRAYTRVSTESEPFAGSTTNLDQTGAGAAALLSTSARNFRQHNGAGAHLSSCGRECTSCHGHGGGTSHLQEQVLLFFILIDTSLSAYPTSVFLVANYCLSFACMYVVPMVFQQATQQKWLAFARSGLFLLSAGFPCWGYLCSLQKIMARRLLLFGGLYLACVFVFMAVVARLTVQGGAADFWAITKEGKRAHLASVSAFAGVMCVLLAISLYYRAPA